MSEDLDEDTVDEDTQEQDTGEFDVIDPDGSEGNEEEESNEDNSEGILTKLGNIIGGNSEESKEDSSDPSTESQEHQERDLDISINPFTDRVSDEHVDEELQEHQERVGFGVEIVIAENEWDQIDGSNVVHGMVYDTTSDLTVDGGDSEIDHIDVQQIERDGDKVIRHWIDSRVVSVDDSSVEPNLDYHADGSSLVWIWTTDQNMAEEDIRELDIDVTTGSEKELADELRNYVSRNPNVPSFKGHLRTPTIKKVDFDQNHTTQF